jgi:hypothetical protein
MKLTLGNLLTLGAIGGIIYILTRKPKKDVLVITDDEGKIPASWQKTGLDVEIGEGYDDGGSSGEEQLTGGGDGDRGSGDGAETSSTQTGVNRPNVSFPSDYASSGSQTTSASTLTAKDEAQTSKSGAVKYGSDSVSKFTDFDGVDDKEYRSRTEFDGEE